MTVYVLFRETNSGKFDDSDGYIEAVYATEADAKEAMTEAIRAAIAEGVIVWYDPDDPAGEDQAQPSNWEADWRIEPHEVK